MPGGRASIIVWPAGRGAPIRVRKRLDDEIHPNGLSSVWLHPVSGEVLRATPWRDGAPGLIGFEYAYPLHSGRLGGFAGQALTAVSGVALAVLAFTGPFTWLRRRRRRSSASVERRPRAACAGR